MSVHDFIISTDYATLKNDDSDTISLAITTGFSVAPGATRTFESFVTAGSVNSQISALMYSSATNVRYAATAISIKMSGNYGGGTLDIWQYVILEKSDDSTVRLFCRFHNSQVVTMNVTGGGANYYGRV